MTTAAEFYALQDIDLALDRALGRLAEIAAALVEIEELLATRQDVEDKRRIVNDLRSRQSELEWSVEEVRTKSSDIETRLYGGSVHNPKELADLDADLRSLRSQTRTREDTLLGLLVEVEEGEQALAAAEAEYARIAAAWQAEQEQLLAEKARLEPEIAQLQSRRDAESAAMDRATLSLYQLLRERKGGQAVARVERGMCQGCRITLPMSALQKARTGLGLVQCVSCERILLVN